MNIFVYGTLKEGFGANTYLQPAKLLASQVPIKGFRMFTNGVYPMVVASADNEDTVYGEVWEIKEDALRILDNYEGHPNLFKRTWLDSDRIQFNNDEGVMIYLYNREINPYVNEHIASGIFE